MQPDILVNRLQMKVEPADSSYMPSLVVVSGGDSVHSLKELRMINVGATFTTVTLLEDVTEVCHFFSCIKLTAFKYCNFNVFFFFLIIHSRII